MKRYRQKEEVCNRVLQRASCNQKNEGAGQWVYHKKSGRVQTVLLETVVEWQPTLDARKKSLLALHFVTISKSNLSILC